MSDTSERRAAGSVVADYHHAQLGELVARVGEAVDRYRVAGLMRSTSIKFFSGTRVRRRGLWTFCNYLPVEVAAMNREQPPHDWWERAAPSKR